MHDFAKSVEAEEEAIELYSQLKVSLQKTGFNLTKWISSIGNVVSSFPENDRAESTKKTFAVEPDACLCLGFTGTWKKTPLKYAVALRRYFLTK